MPEERPPRFFQEWPAELKQEEQGGPAESKRAEREKFVGGHIRNDTGENGSEDLTPIPPRRAAAMELLKQIAPRVTRAAVLRNPADVAGTGQLGAMQSVAPALGLELTPIDVRDAAEMERAIGAFAQRPNAGLLVPGSAPAIFHRKLIVELAARHRLPAVYANRYFGDDGGLISYGADNTEVYRLAAGYIDRILKGEKPADLPVHQATKVEMILNLKTAKTLGIEVPPPLLARADEVIE